MTTTSIPQGFHAVTPSLTLKNSLKAIEFYKKAFNAKTLEVMPAPDGEGTMHATIQIGDSIVMMGDASPRCQSAESLGASPVSFYIYVSNVDAAFKQAIAAGATAVMPVAEMFWGDRAGSLKDPFGYAWMIATHTRDLNNEQIQQGAQAFFAQMAQAGQ